MPSLEQDQRPYHGDDVVLRDEPEIAAVKAHRMGGQGKEVPGAETHTAVEPGKRHAVRVGRALVRDRHRIDDDVLIDRTDAIHWTRRDGFEQMRIVRPAPRGHECSDMLRNQEDDVTACGNFLIQLGDIETLRRAR